MKAEEYYYEVRRKVEEKISSAFSLDNGYLPYIKPADIIETTWFDNKVSMKFDKSSLPTSCNALMDLRNRFLLYGIYCNGKFYVGKTNDFGERMITHIRDARKKEEKRLHKDMRNGKESFAFIFCELRSQEELDEAEHMAIKIAKNASLLSETTREDGDWYTKYVLESKELTAKYQSKRCYNIAN